MRSTGIFGSVVAVAVSVLATSCGSDANTGNTSAVGGGAHTGSGGANTTTQASGGNTISTSASGGATSAIVSRVARLARAVQPAVRLPQAARAAAVVVQARVARWPPAVMVADGTYYNDQCCFDFGNAETQGISAGPHGSMHAIYLGNCTFWNKGAGSGPWIMADLESGLFNTTGAVGATNNNDPSMPYPFVTAMTKNDSAGKTSGPFTLKGANAQTGTLAVYWDGARPTGYDAMQKQGAIVLGIGGDTGSGARGNFFEGAMRTVTRRRRLTMPSKPTSSPPHTRNRTPNIS
jgi:non-reducing end alpha-L-arabinofuranosidase